MQNGSYVHILQFLASCSDTRSVLPGGTGFCAEVYVCHKMRQRQQLFTPPCDHIRVVFSVCFCVCIYMITFPHYSTRHATSAHSSLHQCEYMCTFAHKTLRYIIYSIHSHSTRSLSGSGVLLGQLHTIMHAIAL